MIVDTQVALLAENLIPTTKINIKVEGLSGFEALMAALITGSIPANTNIPTGVEMLPDLEMLPGIEMLPVCLNTKETDVTANKKSGISTLPWPSCNENILLQRDDQNSAQQVEKSVAFEAEAELMTSSNDQMYGWGYVVSELPSNPVKPTLADLISPRKDTEPQVMKAELIERTTVQQNIQFAAQDIQQSLGGQKIAESVPVQASIQPEEASQLQRLQQVEKRGQPVSAGEEEPDSILLKTDTPVISRENHVTMFLRDKPDSLAIIAQLIGAPVNEVTELSSEPLKVPARDIAQELPKIIFSQQKIGQSGEGSKEFMIQLEPEEMGRMIVKLNSHEGMVSVRIYAENQEARSIIENGLQSLKQSFEEQGIRCGRMDVELGGHYLNQNNFQQHQWFGESYSDIPRGWYDRQYYADLELAASGIPGQVSGNGIDYRV